MESRPLEQVEENRAVPMSAAKAAAALIGGATAHSWLKSDMERLTNRLTQRIKTARNGESGNKASPKPQ